LYLKRPLPKQTKNNKKRRTHNQPQKQQKQQQQQQQQAIDDVHTMYLQSSDVCFDGSCGVTILKYVTKRCLKKTMLQTEQSSLSAP